MKRITTSILPREHTFVKSSPSRDLNYEAICVFVATGFFMDSDTYWKNEHCLAPGSVHAIGEDGFLKSSEPWFEWFYEPQSLSFEDTLESYINLLTEITKDHIRQGQIILPLSGGLDSRSQALILKKLDHKALSYSYRFAGGYPEDRIAKQVAKSCGFDFKAFQIPKCYLWNCIDELAKINRCYSEFTHQRQMAILPALKDMNGVFSLGHWGDVFFDRGVPEGTTEEEVMPLLFKKMIKKDGLELGEQLWNLWGLDGNLKAYLENRISNSLKSIKIENLSAKLRAFKTVQWAHRWTTTNLSVFKNAHPINMPFYDDRMCKWICTIPEDYLVDRRLQIAHLKTDSSLANITWHAHRPFSITNADLDRSPYNLPYRIYSKANREIKRATGRPFIQRNFELQFRGKNNDQQLRRRIFNDSFTKFIPKSIIQEFYERFNSKSYVANSHAISMLLTLALWNQYYND